jgi:hypothetical protein
MMTLARQSSPDRAARTLEGIAANGASTHSSHAAGKERTPHNGRPPQL